MINSMLATLLFAVAAPAPSEYDVAAYVWPAYQPEPRWAELGIFGKGIGEWQNVQEAQSKWPGHRQPLVPLWGYENEADPQVVANKIDAATAAGVNVFIYDWYWYGGRPFLENALNEGFLKASNRGKMKFFVMWANHHVDRIWDNRAADKQGDRPLWRGWVSAEEFRDLVPRWINRYFREPNYYRIGGKPVFMIYNLGIFIEGVGGEGKAVEALDGLRAACRKAGLGGVHLMTCDRRGLKPEWIEKLGIDSATTYTYRMWSDPEGNKDYAPWAEKAIERFDAAKRELKGLKAYFAHASAGWDTNPRYPASVKMATAVDATPAKFEQTMRKVREWCDRNTPAGMPKLITLNAWNEWTEGSYLEPDTEFGYGWLEAVRRVFGPAATNRPWRVFNEDNDHWFCAAKSNEVNEAGLRAYIDGIADMAKPTHMFLCPCGQRASFDSKAWEPIWAGLNDPDAAGKTNHPWCVNAKRLHDQGVDAYHTWIDQCRRRGISPWLSMRVNDDHIMVVPHYFRNETFWREHPELRKHPELDPWAPGASKNWSLYSYDYSHSEVRDHQFAMFKELVWRYDADGIEIDWLRTPGVFAPGKEKEGLPLITEFMRRCRREANLAAKARGRAYPIAVRLPVMEPACRSYGFDPLTWAKERLADVFIFSDCGSTADFDVDTAWWREHLGRAYPGVRVLVGTDTSYACAPQSKFRALELRDLAVLRAWIARYADEPGGLYFFNSQYLPQSARNEMYVNSLFPDSVNRGLRRFPMSFHDAIGVGADKRRWWRLPYTVARPLELTVQAVPGPRDGRAEVVLGFDAAVPDAPVTLNGVAAEGPSMELAETKPYSNLAKCVRAWRFPVSAVRKGANKVVIPSMPGASAQTVWCEIALR